MQESFSSNTAQPSSLSNTAEQSFSSNTIQQSFSAAHFTNQEHLSAEDLRLRVGQTLFSLPDFGQDDKSETSEARDTHISPTQPQDGFQLPGQFS
jgi:hypothetical protein